MTIYNTSLWGYVCDQVYRMTWLIPTLVELSNSVVSVYDCCSLFCSSSENVRNLNGVNNQNKQNRFVPSSEGVTACSVHPLNGIVMAGTKVCGLKALFLWKDLERESLTWFISFISCLLNFADILVLLFESPNLLLARYLGNAFIKSLHRITKYTEYNTSICKE